MRLIKRKTAQLESKLLFAAMAYYNAAAGYFNAGEPDRALDCGGKAASHPELKNKAEELVRRIKSFP